MKLSTKSLHYKLYELAWGETNYRRIKNLCPYFWKLLLGVVLMATIIPHILILPLLFIKQIREEVKETGVISFYMFGGFIAWICVIIVGILLIGPFMGTKSDLFTSSMIIWAVLILGGTVFLIQHYREEREEKESKPNIVVEFVKAKYNKYCPIIEWENNK